MLEGVEAEPLPIVPPEPEPQPGLALELPRWLQWEEIDARRRQDGIRTAAMARPIRLTPADRADVWNPVTAEWERRDGNF